MKKIFTLLLAVLAGVEISNATVVSGTCGNNLTWSYNTESCILTIEGTGNMYDYCFGTMIDFDCDNPRPWNAYSSQIKTIIFSDQITSIGDGAFQNCSGLQTAAIPNSVKRIGTWTFAWCTNLTSVGTETTGIQYFGRSAFDNCCKLTSINFGTNVVEIGGDAFSGCETLKDVTIPNSLTKIEDGTFEGCDSFTSIRIPDNITRIGDRAFAECKNLTVLTIGLGVKSIGGYAFAECKKLKSVTCLATTPPVMSLEYYHLPCDDCEGGYYIEESIDEYSPVFDEVVCYNIPLYVPTESVNAYQHTDQWKDFAPISPIQDSEGIEEVFGKKSNGNKVIREGVILVEKNGKTYNTKGAEVR